MDTSFQLVFNRIFRYNFIFLRKIRLSYTSCKSVWRHILLLRYVTLHTERSYTMALKSLSIRSLTTLSIIDYRSKTKPIHFISCCGYQYIFIPFFCILFIYLNSITFFLLFLFINLFILSFKFVLTLLFTYVRHCIFVTQIISGKQMI